MKNFLKGFAQYFLNWFLFTPILIILMTGNYLALIVSIALSAITGNGQYNLNAMQYNQMIFTSLADTAKETMDEETD